MTAVAFDTYRVVKRLREAGFDERQAEAVTTAIQDSVTVDLSNLVTKDHFDERMKGVDEHLKAFEARLEDRVTKVHLDERMKSLEARLEERMDHREARLVAKIAESKADTLKAVMGMISGSVAINVLTILGSMLALVKMLGH